MSDYSLSLLNAVSHSNNTVNEYYIIPCALFILFIISSYIHFQHKRINIIEKYLEEINAEYREHYYFRCEEKLRTYFKESYDNLDVKINRESDTTFEKIDTKISILKDSISKINDTNVKLIDSIISEINHTHVKILDSIMAVADEANKAITSTNSKVEEHNIQENAYQTFIGTGEYAQEGNYKYTAEIKIVNKGLHTFGENKRWVKSVNDASVAYKDSLIEQIKYYHNYDDINNLINNMGSWIGFNNNRKNYPVIYTEINTDNSEIKMSCYKFEWNNSIEIHIIGKKIYDNRPENLRGVQYQNQVLPHVIFNQMSYNWKKSLETC